jgi:DNA-binding response OmpR family regulator
VTANPANLTAISDMPAEAVIIRRNHRSTSSDSAVIIRRKPRSRSVGIHIFITAFDEPEARAKAAKLGSVFLAKPFSGRVLLETIRSIGRASDQRAPPAPGGDTFLTDSSSPKG